jgi:small subunit ribosomal protein S16
MLAIRLRRAGAKKRPFFRIVVTEAAAPREGRFVEVIGHYNPRAVPEELTVDHDRYRHWVKVGAQPSDSVRTLVGRHKPQTEATPAEATPAEA